MRPAHKLYSILQLISVIFIIIYFVAMAINPIHLLGLFAVVFFLEILILEEQNKYKKEEIFYYKSGFFAALDIISILFFLLKFLTLFINLFTPVLFLENRYYLVTLLGYTFIRKIYIYKNYTYEK